MLRKAYLFDKGQPLIKIRASFVPACTTSYTSYSIAQSKNYCFVFCESFFAETASVTSLFLLRQTKQN